MADIGAINLFLDEALVDELWTLAKRDGIPIERVKEASAKIAAKSKFGLGKLWQWMTADLEAELSGEAAGKLSQKLQFTSIFRALVLPELIGDIARFDGVHESSIGDLEPGGFIEIETPTLELVPLPTFAGFLRQMTITAAGESQEDSQPELDLDKTLSFADRLTSAQRALTFVLRIQGGTRSSALARLYESESEEVFNALCMSNDDHVLGLSPLGTAPRGPIAFSVLEERYLKRHLAVFAVGRPIRFFGRVAYLSPKLLGIQAVSISLS